jgi:hypothetical protein
MVMPHDPHHEQMRNWAQQHHAEKYNLAKGDLKEINGYQTRNRDQTA